MSFPPQLFFSPVVFSSFSTPKIVWLNVIANNVIVMNDLILVFIDLYDSLVLFLIELVWFIIIYLRQIINSLH